MTRVQRVSDSGKDVDSEAFNSKSGAPTAERASRQVRSKGSTTDRVVRPKLAMARAAAPILRGLRGATRTTSMRSRWEVVSKQPL